MSIIQRYGLICGLLWANLPFVIYYSGLLKSPVAQYLQITALVLYVGFIAAGIAQQKKRLGNQLILRDGLRIGLGISMITAVLIGISLYSYYTFLDHSYIEDLRIAGTTSLTKQGLSPEEIKDRIASAQSQFPFQSALQTSSLIILGGGIISLIASLIMSNRKKTYIIEQE
ncbi:MAG: DUF4199 domain-containing protein [Bacteroidota bacterium]|nr:DUF4199 domain-containing protein [Bacteroidota bacterium]